MVICLEQGADLHTAQLMPLPLNVSCFCKIQIGFTFLVPAYPGSPGQRAVKWVCVCVCVIVTCGITVLVDNMFLTESNYRVCCCKPRDHILFARNVICHLTVLVSMS